MRRFVAFLTLTCGSVAHSQSALPQISLNTGGKPILDDPKIDAQLSITPALGSPANWKYSGLIGIEFRGNRSLSFPKKSYGLSLKKKSEGGTGDTSLLGLPAENDWVLYAAYEDRSLLRNAVGYDLARSLGISAPRTTPVELTLNGQYEGVYYLVEKIKRGHLVPLTEATAGQTNGGYLLQLVPDTDSPTEPHFTLPTTSYNIIVEYPKKPDPAQMQDISRYFSSFVNQLYAAAPQHPDGYRQYVNLPSFVDYLLINELFKNGDAFYSSTFFSKEPGAPISAGPLWDLDGALGLLAMADRRDAAGWLLPRVLITEQFFKDPLFTQQFVKRWQEWKALGLRQRISDTIDRHARQIAPATARNFQRWPVLGVASPNLNFVGKTHAEEVALLKDWMLRRYDWMDAHLNELNRK